MLAHIPLTPGWVEVKPVKHADTSPTSSLGTVEELAGEARYRKGLTRTIPCFFSFRKQARTVGLSSTWSASMGRAHGPARGSRNETLLTLHLSPRCTVSPPLAGGSPSTEVEAQPLALLGKEAGGRRPGGWRESAATLPASRLGWDTSAGKEEELCSSTSRSSVSWLGGTK